MGNETFFPVFAQYQLVAVFGNMEMASIQSQILFKVFILLWFSIIVNNALASSSVSKVANSKSKTLQIAFDSAHNDLEYLGKKNVFWYSAPSSVNPPDKL